MNVRFSMAPVTVILAACAFVLAGCAGTAGGGGSYRDVSPVSAVELTESLRLETDWARSFIQDGQATRYAALDEWRPFCDIEHRKVARRGEPPIVVEPGRFTVTRVQVFQPHRGVIHPGPVGLTDTEPFEFRYRFYLESAAQPDVLALNCTARYRSYPYPASALRGLSLSQMRDILGPVVVMESAG